MGDHFINEIFMNKGSYEVQTCTFPVTW